jgi:hypothetical protein
MKIPVFPEFKYLVLEDSEVINFYLKKYPSEASDYTFTNMFIWRSYYRIQWSILEGTLLILYNPMNWGYYFLQPIGPRDRGHVTVQMLRWLREVMDEPEPRIERADEKYIGELNDNSSFNLVPVRDQYDYVYCSTDLIQLAGRRFHTKKNHLNQFIKSYEFQYKTLSMDDTDECIHVLKKWCNWRECDKNLLLRAEYEAVYESLIHLGDLEIAGAVILVHGEIVAFSMGEQISEDTALIHVEKANSKMPGSFAVINQQFAENQWSKTTFINREQDLGVEGLRKAKESYHPHHMIKKYRVSLK